MILDSEKINWKTFLGFLLVLVAVIALVVLGYRRVTAEPDGGGELYPVVPGATRVYEFKMTTDELEFEGALEQVVGSFELVDGVAWAPVESNLTLPSDLMHLEHLVHPGELLLRLDEEGGYQRSDGEAQRVLPFPLKHRSQWVVGFGGERLVYKYLDRGDYSYGGVDYKNCVRLEISSEDKHRPRGVMILAPDVGRVYHRLEAAAGTVEITLVEFRDGGSSE